MNLDIISNVPPEQRTRRGSYKAIIHVGDGRAYFNGIYELANDAPITQTIEAHLKNRIGIDVSLQPAMEWGYTINRWRGSPHYHVSLFAGLTDDFRAVFSFKSGVHHHQKFNTREEANKFVESVRRRLKRRGRALRQHYRDYAR